jgi:hypothetical protein
MIRSVLVRDPQGRWITHHATAQIDGLLEDLRRAVMMRIRKGG